MASTPIVEDAQPAAGAGSGCAHPEPAQVTVFPARDYITGDLFTLRRCGVCGLTRTTPQPDAAGMAHYYPRGYYGRGKRYGRPLEALLDWLYAFRGRLIEMANGLEPGRVLDIGCGRGLLLHQLRKRGWAVIGTEMTEESASHARDVLRIDVRAGHLGDLGFADGEFDTVILWHVLEHIPDPGGLLAEVARILRPGGTLLVAVPNFASIEARASKAHWFHLDVPRHLNHFTPATLRTALGAAGLRPRMVSYFASEYDFFSFVQTALNMLGLRHNLLYNLLRARGAKVLEADQTAAPARDIALTLLLTPALGAISVVWVPVVALLKRGGTVTMYAKKPRV